MLPFLRTLFWTVVILAAGAGPTGSASAATVFALVDTGELYSSDDGGATWSVMAALPVHDAVALQAGGTPQELFLASRRGTVYRSGDGGVAWNAVGSLAASDLVDMAVLADGALVVLTATGTVRVSGDGGVSFTTAGQITASNLVSLCRAGDGNLYALTRTGEVALGTGNGTVWSTVGVIAVPDAVSIREAAGSLYALTFTGLTFRSTDSGVTWSAVGTVSQVGMSGMTSLGGNLVAMSREGLVASSAAGASWSWIGSVNQVNVVAVANDEPQATGVPHTPDSAPRLILAPPRPNPARPGGTLRLSVTLPEADLLTVTLYDPQGRRVADRAGEALPAGTSEIRWTLPDLASGVYFLNLRGNAGIRATSRVLVLP